MQGDVHDIGKNLVDIILTNNGYTVFNLGIKQPVNDILKAAIEKSADAIGMSGLLVKSRRRDEGESRRAERPGREAPGAAGRGGARRGDYAEETWPSFTKRPAALLQRRVRGPAHDGLRSPAARRMAIEHRAQAAHRASQAPPAKRREVAHDTCTRRTSTSRSPRTTPCPLPPFWGRRIVTDISPRQVFPYINKMPLFIGQWGFKQKGTSSEGIRRVDR